MYILISGDCVVRSAEGSALALLEPGASFGELAALGVNQTRSASIQALETCELYCISQENLNATFRDSPEVRL